MYRIHIQEAHVPIGIHFCVCKGKDTFQCFRGAVYVVDGVFLVVLVLVLVVLVPIMVILL